jgi:adenosine deaminase
MSETSGETSDWARLPKAELHLHLEGAAPPSFIRGLAREKSVDIAGVFGEDGGYATGDFARFLKVYEAATSVLTSPEDYRRLTLAVLEEAREAGVVYLETFASPDFCGRSDVAAWRDYVAAMEEAAAEGEARMGIILRAIVTSVRHFGPDKAKRSAICAAETAGAFIVGYGLAGAEDVGAPRDFAWGFDAAREAGLRLTAHAGEWGGPEVVRDTLDALRVERIGHGISAARDPALMERLAEDGITLEVCPGSNVYLGAAPSWERHPIEVLRGRGVRVTVSTDDPPFFRTDLGREWENLERVFRWTPDDLRDLNGVAMDAAFCDADTNARARKLLEMP